MNRRFLGRIPVGHKSLQKVESGDDTKTLVGNSDYFLENEAAKKNRSRSVKDSGCLRVPTAQQKVSTASHNDNHKLLFETSMEISFSLSNPVQSRENSRCCKKKKVKQNKNQEHSLRPASVSELHESSQLPSAEKKTTSSAMIQRMPAERASESSGAPGERPNAEKLQLSAWGLPDVVLERYAEKGIQTMFEWQAECLCTENVLGGGNLVYSAPTSAGKTIVAELLMLKRILETKRKAILILPFVSVAREKMLYLQSIFQDVGVRVGGFMGSHSPPGGLTMTDLAVCTIEKANSLCNRLIEEGSINNIGVVVVDELHLVGDLHRGYLLELLLTKLMFASKKLQQASSEEAAGDIQIIGMSATLPNLDLLSRWLSASLYRTDFRPVPLHEYINIHTHIYDNSLRQLREVHLTKSSQDDVVLSLCLETLYDDQSVLIFCPTKNWCEALSQSLAKDIYTICRSAASNPDKRGVKLQRDQLRDVIEQLRRCPAGLDPVLNCVVPWGTAYHHAGLTMDERDIIEGAFRQGLVRVLVATSTLSSGVNLPARRVIIRTPIFHGKLIDTLTYKQMIGRAGRKGVDTYGESVLVCKKTEEQRAVELVRSELAPVQSCLARDQGLTTAMKRAILEVVVSGLTATEAEVQSYASCTLLAASISENSDHQSNIIQACIEFLLENEIITRRTAAQGGGCSQFIATQLGSAILASSLSPDEGILVFTELQRARRCFVLENELHIIYQVTPVFMADMWSQLDWYQYLCHWEQLSADMRRVAELVGVKESFLARAVRGRVPTATAAQFKTVAIHKRFYTALVLHDLVNEMPLAKVAAKYKVNKGLLQSLQQSAATFAGMVTVFCNRLGWLHLETIFSHFQSRLTFGIQQDLVDLVRLSLLNAHYARVLFSAGYQNIANLAHADPQHIEQLLIQATPFESEKHKEGNAAEKRQRKCIFLAGHSSVTEYQAAVMIVDEARCLLQKDVALMGVQWQPQPSKAGVSNGAVHHASPPPAPQDGAVQNNTASPNTRPQELLKYKNCVSQVNEEHITRHNNETERKENIAPKNGGNESLMQKINNESPNHQTFTANIHRDATQTAQTDQVHTKNKDVQHAEPAVNFSDVSATSQHGSPVAVVKPLVKTPPAMRLSFLGNNVPRINLMQTPNISILSPPAAFKSTQLFRPSPRVQTEGKVQSQGKVQTQGKVSPSTPVHCRNPSTPASGVKQGTSTPNVMSGRNMVTSTPVIPGVAIWSKAIVSPDVQFSRPCSANINKLSAIATANVSPSLYTEQMEESFTENIMAGPTKSGDNQQTDESINIVKNEVSNLEEFMDSFEMDSQALAEVAMLTPKPNRVSTVVEKDELANVAPKETKTVGEPILQTNNVEENKAEEDNFLEDESLMDSALCQYMEHYNSQNDIVAHSASPLLARSHIRTSQRQSCEDMFLPSQRLSPQDVDMFTENKDHGPVALDHEWNAENEEIEMLSEENNLDECILNSQELMPLSCYEREDNSDNLLIDTPNMKNKIIHRTFTNMKKPVSAEVSGLEEDIAKALNMSDSFSWSETNAVLGDRPTANKQPPRVRPQNDAVSVDAKASTSTVAGKASKQPPRMDSDDFDDSLTFSMVENMINDDKQYVEQPSNYPATVKKPSVKSPLNVDDIINRVCKDGIKKPPPMRKTQNAQSQKTNSHRMNGKKTPNKRRSVEAQSSPSQHKVKQTEEEDGDFVPPTPPGSQEDLTKVRSPALQSLHRTLRKTPRTPKRTQGKFKAVTPLERNIKVQRFDTSPTASQSAASSSNPRKSLQQQLVLEDKYFTTDIQAFMGQDPELPAPSIPLTNQSFSIIDVSGNRDLFHHFISEWKKQTSYSICLACHKLTSQDQQCGIGGNFNKPGLVTASWEVDGLAWEEQGLVMVGLAVAWGDVDAYYIALTKKPLICDLDGSLAAGPIDESLSVDERLEAVRSAVTSNTGALCSAFSLKDHYKGLASAGLLLPLQRVQDPQVAEWLLDPGAAKKNIHRLVNTYLPIHVHLLDGLGGGHGVESLGINADNPGSGRLRSCVEAVLVYHLMEQMNCRLQETGLHDAFINTEMPVQVLLARMELNGFGFSEEESESQRSILQGKLSALEEQAYSLAGHAFSLTSTDDIAHILFVELGLPPSGDPNVPVNKKTLGPARRAPATRSRGKTNFSTAKDVLEKLTQLHPLPGVILEWRRLTTILSKVVFALAKEKCYSEKLAMYRIHCQADTHTATGRVTMAEPNLQNIPRDFTIMMPNVLGESPTGGSSSFGAPGARKGRQRWLAEGRTGPSAHLRQDMSAMEYNVSMRNIFIPFQGGVLVAADYSQLELRMIAHLSKDRKLIDILNKGGDVFKLIAAKWKNIEPEAVSDEQRQQAKQVCYGMIYGIGPKALGDQLSVDEDEASVFIETFKSQYTGMRSYLRETVASCRKKGYVTTIMGRRRYLPAITHDNPHAKAHAERQAVNTTVQGSAADMVKKAMIDIDLALQQKFSSHAPYLKHKQSKEVARRRSHRIAQQPSGAYLVLQLHDELIYETSSNRAMDVARLIKQYMENSIKLSVIFPVKIKIGPTWGQLADIEL